MSMAEVKWIKITTGLFSDEKIMLIEQMPEADTLLVIWFKLLCMAGRENNSGVFIMNGTRMPYTDEMLATIFRRPINTVRLALSTFEAFGMIEMDDGTISITNWEKHQNIDGLDKIREQTRKRVQKHRENQKRIECNVTVTDGNATDKNRIDKNRTEKKNSTSEADELFEKLWSMYPLKRGKGQVSFAKKKQLLDIGYEELERAMNRYKADLEKEEWRKPQNGSTFFNSGYVDYLDENYVKPVSQKPVAKNNWSPSKQNDYDFDQLEKELIANGI